MKPLLFALASLTLATLAPAQDTNPPVNDKPVNFFDTSYDPAIGLEGNYIGYFAGVPNAGGPIKMTLTRGGGYEIPERNGTYEWTRKPDAAWHMSGTRADGSAVFGVLGLAPANHTGNLQVTPGGIQFNFSAGNHQSPFNHIKVQIGGAPGGNLRGTWSTKEATGLVALIRVKAKPKRHDAIIVGHPSFSGSVIGHEEWKNINRFSDGPVVSTAKPGERLLVDLGKWYTVGTVNKLFTPQSHHKARGNRSGIRINIYGDDFWGRQYAWISPRSGFEMGGIRPIIHKGEHGKSSVVGLQVNLTMWQDLKPGLHRLYVNGRPIEFILKMPGRVSDEELRKRPMLRVLALKDGKFVPVTGKMARHEVFKVRATYQEDPEPGPQWLSMPGLPVSGCPMHPTDQARVWESRTMRLANPAPTEDVVPQLDEGTLNQVRVIWTETGEPKSAQDDKAVHILDVGELTDIPFHLRGAGLRQVLLPHVLEVPLYLGMDSLLEDPGTPKASAVFAVMDLHFNRKGLTAEQIKSIEGSVAKIEKQLETFAIKLTPAQREELKNNGHIRLDIKSVVTKPTRLYTREPEVLVGLLARPENPPRDLYAHCKALEAAHEQYSKHLAQIQQLQRKLTLAQADTQKVIDRNLPRIKAVHQVALAAVAVRQAFPPTPEKPEPKPVDKDAEARLAELKAKETKLHLYVVTDGMNLSHEPKPGFVEADEEVARLKDAYQGIHEKLKEALARGEGKFNKVADLVKAPELVKIQKRIDWLEGQQAGLKLQRAEVNKEITFIQQDQAIKLAEWEKRTAKIKAEAQAAEKTYVESLKKLAAQLKAAQPSIPGTTPVFNPSSAGSDTHGEMFFRNMERWCDTQLKEAHTEIAAATHKSRADYKAWENAKAGLPQHTAYVLQVRQGAVSAVIHAYKEMSDSSPYDEFLKELKTYNTILGHAKTLIMHPTQKNLDLMLKGGLEAGYERKFESMKVDMASGAMRSVFLGEMFPSIRLAGTHLKQQTCLARPYGEFQRSRDSIPGIRDHRSAIDRFDEGMGALETTAKVFSLGTSIVSTADAYNKNDPTAAFQSLGTVMNSMSLLQKARVPGIHIGGRSFSGFDFSAFKLPIRGALLSTHLAILAQGGTAIVKAGDRIADSKLEQAMKVSLEDSPKTHVYHVDNLHQYYKTYVGGKGEVNPLKQRLATRLQLEFINHQIATYPMKGLSK